MYHAAVAKESDMVFIGIRISCVVPGIKFHGDAFHNSAISDPKTESSQCCVANVLRYEADAISTFHPWETTTDTGGPELKVGTKAGGIELVGEERRSASISQGVSQLKDGSIGECRYGSGAAIERQAGGAGEIIKHDDRRT
jgi:hypothetical protein